jgi:hypothetical protein
MNAKREGLERIVKGVAKVVDNWGWKGDPTGRITAGDVADSFNKSFNQLKRKRSFEDQYSIAWDIAFERNLEKISNLADRFSKSSDPWYRQISEDPYAVLDLAKNIDALEKADIPIEWTGKVAKPLTMQLQRTRDTVSPILAQQVSDLMRPMTDDQRYMFVKLMSSNISGQTLDRIASTVRRITKS